MEMRTVALPDGERVPALGQGTWRMGENKSAHADEVAALRLGIDLGMTLIDTAEMYGEGAAKKSWPTQSPISGIACSLSRKFIRTMLRARNYQKACERSLTRLRIEAISLFTSVPPSAAKPVD